MSLRIYSLMLLGFTLPVTASALDRGEFLSHRNKLRAQQEKTDSLVTRLRKKFHLTPEADPLNQEEEEEGTLKPLIQYHATLSSALIQPGKLLYGKTLNRLVVGSEESPALITLEQDQGSMSGLRILGLARQGATEGRINFEFSQVQFSNGKVVPIQATALDSSGAYGLEAQVLSHKALQVAGAIGSSLISGMAASQQTQSANAFGFSSPEPTGRNAILQGLAQTAADQSKRLIDESTSEKPILIIESQTPIVVLIQKEVLF